MKFCTFIVVFSTLKVNIILNINFAQSSRVLQKWLLIALKVLLFNAALVCMNNSNDHT